jgi:predicted dehydrogenase/threonine dehydrogenase-like Zn-dependent dehydrogenase
MKQVRQFLRSGSLQTGEVPLPGLRSCEVLVRTHFSFISVGTEKMKVTQARMNLAAKARERPDQVKQVIQTLKEQGFGPTVRKVQERLRTPTTLGYSCAGVVAAVGSQVDEFRVGDRVACIGEAVATHAEYNAVPRTVLAPVPVNVSLEAASSSAIGAIALQAVRQARLELGMSVAVIGLGLLGQFLVQLCRANGCSVLGIDLDSSKCQLALASGAQVACDADETEALLAALRISHGAGVDVVLLTTSTKDNQPIEMAAQLVRDRGRVVCLGNTAINLDWRLWFSKEIEFLFSRAMGAGIYDPDYFTRGNDYPIGYIRWSANRNMIAFLDLLAQNRIDLSNLITHRFAFDKAVNVFNDIANGELGSAVGIVFEYPNPERDTPESELRTIRFASDGPRRPVRLGMIGAGNYAKSMILPYFSSLQDLSLMAICTARGMNAEALAQRYGFRKATTDAAEIFGDAEINTVAVATRHDSHAQYAQQALKVGKSVYVEKPLAMNEEQLAVIIEALGDRKPDGPTLWVGYNRRFAPLSCRAMEHMEGVPVRQVSCTIRAASVPADSWYQDPAEGGGILFGDVCHFIDLAIWFQRSLPTEVHAFATRDLGHCEESWVVQLRFINGGLSTVHYVCGSQQGWERETIDILGGGRSARISGFRKLTLNRGRRTRKSTLLQPDLGQKPMLQTMIAQFSRAPGAVDYTDSFIIATQALLAAHRSIQERRVVLIDSRFPYTLD